MTTFLFHFHSGLRWILVLGVLIALIRLAMLWIQRKEYTGFDTTLNTVVTALFDVQLLLGIVLLYMMSNGFAVFLRHHMEHAFTMILAIVVVHLQARWKKSPGAIRARNSFILLLIAVILVIVGIAILPQGWNL